ncbi:serine/arginine repetitive matrix protein 2 [Aethina tumida]|uniref:serine/arginine repetitive matrix protein 2 n=1 Tax=Aethina tumida TaxID=116153 RepID=UPI002148A3DB|nr:serine/arginine repetitive matrix protein 2 [Aethina tumida]
MENDVSTPLPLREVSSCETPPMTSVMDSSNNNEVSAELHSSFDNNLGVCAADTNYVDTVSGNAIPSLMTPPLGTPRSSFGSGTIKYAGMIPKIKKRKCQSEVLEDIQFLFNECDPPREHYEGWKTPPSYRPQYLERTPPLFSRNPRIAQLGSQLEYNAKDFGVDQFQHWTDAEQYMKYATKDTEDFNDSDAREKREKVHRMFEMIYLDENNKENKPPTGFQLPKRLQKRLMQTKTFKYSMPRGPRAPSPPPPQIEEDPVEYTCAPMVQDPYTEKLKKRAIRDAKKSRKKEQDLQKQKEAEQKTIEEELYKQQNALETEEFTKRAIAARKVCPTDSKGQAAVEVAVHARQLTADQDRKPHVAQKRGISRSGGVSALKRGIPPVITQCPPSTRGKAQQAVVRIPSSRSPIVSAAAVTASVAPCSQPTREIHQSSTRSRMPILVNRKVAPTEGRSGISSRNKGIPIPKSNVQTSSSIVDPACAPFTRGKPLQAAVNRAPSSRTRIGSTAALTPSAAPRPQPTREIHQPSTRSRIPISVSRKIAPTEGRSGISSKTKGIPVPKSNVQTSSSIVNPTCAPSTRGKPVEPVVNRIPPSRIRIGSAAALTASAAPRPQPTRKIHQSSTRSRIPILISRKAALTKRRSGISSRNKGLLVPKSSRSSSPVVDLACALNAIQQASSTDLSRALSSGRPVTSPVALVAGPSWALSSDLPSTSATTSVISPVAFFKMDKSDKTSPASKVAFIMVPIDEECDPKKLGKKSESEEQSSVNILAERPPSQVNISPNKTSKPPVLSSDIREQAGSSQSPCYLQPGFMNKLYINFPLYSPSRTLMQFFVGKKMDCLRGFQMPRGAQIRETPTEQLPCLETEVDDSPPPQTQVCPLREPSLQAGPPSGFVLILDETDEVATASTTPLPDEQDSDDSLPPS